ncbi:MAG: FliA/WhiG family RNA polymerase sigma factor [Planctomycetia bacterium]|nr:FliA/WhiG family RNA polymerase sigma factor [Planctomycetia bacterium]
MSSPIISENTDVELLWKEYKENPTVEIRNQLIEIYMPLVRFNGERVRARFPNEVELDDLISSGYFGLMDAIEAYDLSRGVKFETYCTARIQGAMLDEIRNLDWVPRLIRSRASKLNDVVRKLEISLGRTPTDAEISQAMEISLAEVQKLKKETATVGLVSLNRKHTGEAGEKEVHEVDVLEDRRCTDPTQGIQRKDFMKLITRGLSQNERLIIILYYYEEMTMKEIGATLDLSESRVSQMHTAVVRRLQDQLKSRQAELANSFS